MSDKEREKPPPAREEKWDKGRDKDHAWRDAEEKRIDRGGEGPTHIEKMWRPDPWPDPPPPPRDKEQEKE